MAGIEPVDLDMFPERLHLGFVHFHRSGRRPGIVSRGEAYGVNPRVCFFRQLSEMFATCCIERMIGICFLDLDANN
jgi:hypothetical protein